MVWSPDSSLSVTITAILEGFSKIVSHTFPTEGSPGDSISGSVTIKNDSASGSLGPDSFRVVVTRQDNSQVILDDQTPSDIILNSSWTSQVSVPFALPTSGVNLLIETFHWED